MTALPTKPTRPGPWKLWLGYLGLSFAVSLLSSIVTVLRLGDVLNEDQLFFSVLYVLIAMFGATAAALGVSIVLTVIVSAAGALGARTSAAWELVGVCSTALLVAGLAAIALSTGTRGFPPLVLDTALIAGFGVAIVLSLFTWRYRSRAPRVAKPA